MKLHDYQEYAVKFIEEHKIAALLLDMGLGKTITTLTAINNLMYDLFEVRKVLIIAPLRVARDTWSARNRKMGTSETPEIQRGSWNSRREKSRVKCRRRHLHHQS